uniref:Methyl-accepting chemotaxis sensory transducer n=1 Tax=Rhodopseudomonas palustris (strain BisA53) TaxID=316055 RepID=Q07VM7_RHOP5
MSWLNNIKITSKILLIVALLAVVTLASVFYATSKMRAMDDANTDMVSRVDKSTTLAARASRRAENYMSSAFQLLAETTDAGNAKILAQAVESREAYNKAMATVLKDMPEQASSIEPTIAQFTTAFAACRPIMEAAAKTTDAADNLIVSARLKAECVPVMTAAMETHAKLVSGMLANVAKLADQMTVDANSTIRTVWVASIVGLLLGLSVALWIGIKGLSQSVNRLKHMMEKLAANDLAIAISGTERRDELGDMARTLDVFKTSALEVQKMRADQQATEKRNAEQRKSDMQKLASDFESAVGEIIETVSSSSTELEASAGTLTSTAERSQQLTSMVAAASEEASANVQSVASATEEMASSVNEISRQVQESARIANDAVDQAKNTNDRVGELSQAAGRIGAVVELINTIAGQTNLLALNATIEAARAGEAGRGFAVVASEVKALAEQTAKATGEISQQINGIQAATQGSVAAIKQISATIGRMSEISSTIASAVEEQGAATQEISRNVQQAAQGTQQVSANITDVQRGASETGSASSQVLSAAQSLSRDSNRLKLEVGKFLNTVRAA